jgi:hypothetical protein
VEQPTTAELQTVKKMLVSGIRVLLETTFKDRRLVIQSGMELITEYVNREYPFFKTIFHHL